MNIWQKQSMVGWNGPIRVVEGDVAKEARIREIQRQQTNRAYEFAKMFAAAGQPLKQTPEWRHGYGLKTPRPASPAPD